VPAHPRPRRPTTPHAATRPCGLWVLQEALTKSATIGADLRSSGNMRSRPSATGDFGGTPMMILTRSLIWGQ